MRQTWLKRPNAVTLLEKRSTIEHCFGLWRMTDWSTARFTPLFPPKTEYRLSAEGLRQHEPAAAMYEWATTNAKFLDEIHSRHKEAETWKVSNFICRRSACCLHQCGDCHHHQYHGTAIESSARCKMLGAGKADPGHFEQSTELYLLRDSAF